jgi:hypothetical protein
MKTKINKNPEKQELLYKRNFPIYEINLKDIKVDKKILHDKLNPKVWENEKINPEVKEQLLKIAHEFYNFLDLPIPVEDIILTGSLANFNYTRYSDFDVHLVVDFNKINSDQNLVNEFFKTKNALWEIKHDIKVEGFPVQLYVQDKNEKHYSKAIFSLKNNKWISKPAYKDFEIDTETLKSKIKKIVDKIENLEKYKTNPEMLYIYAKDLKDQIMNMRQSGLESNGEFSLENIAFKYLRNGGYITRLKDAITSSFDKIYTK